MNLTKMGTVFNWVIELICFTEYLVWMLKLSKKGSTTVHLRVGENGGGTAALAGSLMCSSDGENLNSCCSMPMRIPESPGFSDVLGNCPWVPCNLYCCTKRTKESWDRGREKETWLSNPVISVLTLREEEKETFWDLISTYAFYRKWLLGSVLFSQWKDIMWIMEMWHNYQVRNDMQIKRRECGRV